MEKERREGWERKDGGEKRKGMGKGGEV